MDDERYSGSFYGYANVSGVNSAGIITALLCAHIQTGSVLDVGGAAGAWAAAWRAAGVDAEVVDGHWVDPSLLMIPQEKLHRRHLTDPFDLGRRFDLLQSLEVAEHIDAAYADVFIDSLVRHGDVIFFSAAVPGQGGAHHVNEQPLQYWREKFAVRGFDCFDWLRPNIADQKSISPWYRFNALIYANEAGQARLSDEVRACRVQGAIPDFSDLVWRARCMAVRMLPRAAIEFISARIGEARALT